MSFVNATRQNLRTLTSLKYEAGQQTSYDISRVGFLSKIYLRFEGKVNAKHASKSTFAKAAEAPYNLANRVRLVLNNGTSIWDTSGYGVYMLNLINKLNYVMDNQVAGSKIFQFGNTCSSAGTDNDLCFSLELNMSLNEKDMLGLIMLQSSQVVATIQVDNAQPGVLTTDTDIEMTVTGNWHLSYEYFEIPVDVANYPVIDVIHQVLEDNNTIHSTGENRIVIPRGHTYLRIINSVKINGKLSLDDVDRMNIKYNLSNEPYTVNKDDFLMYQRSRYGRDLPAGMYAWDLFYQGYPNYGTVRDWVQSANITEFDQFIHIKGDATLGSNNNTVRTVREMLADVNAAV